MQTASHIFNLEPGSPQNPRTGLKIMRIPEMLSSAISTFRRYASSIQVESFDVMEVFSMNWHLGFTAFGGPPVHFKIVRNHAVKAFISTNHQTDITQLHNKFVEKNKWIDEQLVNKP